MYSDNIKNNQENMNIILTYYYYYRVHSTKSQQLCTQLLYDNVRQ